ncbi:MAG TPA: M56 family metallopeptidase [Longimicrobium sp.]|nr:M56 family metallopeptidase [Longimicrobium sp.]
MKTISTLMDAGWLPLLAELALKATLVLLLTAVVAALLWRASAAVRHLVWCVGVAGVLALPLFSSLLPAWEVPVLAAPAAPAATAPSGPAPAASSRAPLHAAAGAPSPAPVSASPSASAPAPAKTPREWLPGVAAALAVAGALAGLLWLVAGFWGVSRIGRRAEVVKDPAWLAAAHEAAEKLGLRRPVLLLRSRGAMMPATWGLLWPSVVIPATADQWPDDRRRAVLAHELAHVKRFDCLTQAAAQIACVLFWWHPAVWYAARRLRVERERACDDLVLGAGTRASEYAAHLLEVARSHRAQWLAAPALVSMARPSHLESRLLWVLDAARARGVPSAGATLLAMLAGMLVVAPLAAMRPAQADGIVALDAAKVSRAAKPGRGIDVDVADIGARALRDAADREGGRAGAPPRKDGLAERIAARIAAKDKAGPAGADTPRVRTRQDREVDQLIAMRIHGVDAEYIRGMRELGWTDLEPEQLTGMATVGVTPEYVAALRRLGYTSLTPAQVTGMRVQGVTPRWAEEMNALGFGRIPADQLIGMRVHGVTADWAREMRELLGRITLDQLVGMKVHGISPAYVRELRALLPNERLDADEVTGMRIHGVTPGFVRDLAAVGLTGLTADQVTAFRIHGVSAAYVRDLREAGFSSRLTPEQLINLRVSGVDRDLVRERTRP